MKVEVEIYPVTCPSTNHGLQSWAIVRFSDTIHACIAMYGMTMS